jgi:hypothetical protein
MTAPSHAERVWQVSTPKGGHDSRIVRPRRNGQPVVTAELRRVVRDLENRQVKVDRLQ